MSNARLDRMRNVVQEDVGNRGLRADAGRNLISDTSDDFRAACGHLVGTQSLSPAGTALAGLAIVTGFFIPTAEPPAGETDGPLGAVFLARALLPLGMRVVIAADDFCARALHAGLRACGLHETVPVVALPTPAEAERMGPNAYRQRFHQAIRHVGITHLLAIERVGPSHTDRCRTMRGIDVTDSTSPAHWLFEGAHGLETIGIGDGGNEIGMGKIAREVIGRNIPRGELIACRVPTDHLIVAGISNWGAYALAAGIYALRRVAPSPKLFDPEVERRILEVMVADGPLVDGVLGRPSVTVDGLSWERYAAVLPQLRDLVG